MRNNRFRIYYSVLAAALLISVALVPVSVGSLDIGGALRLFGVTYVVDMFSVELNDFINTITFNRGLAQEESTKVVPIISIGNGAYIGAAQVSGPARQVASVQAVGQLEGDFLDSSLRARVLIPVDNKNPLHGFRRVREVGVSAIVDLAVQPGSPPQQQPVPPAPISPAPVTPAPPPVVSPQPRDPVIVYPTPKEPDTSWLPYSPAFDYAVFAGDDIELSGNNIHVAGDIRANDDVLLRGNRTVISGRIEAYGSVVGLSALTQPMSINQTKTTGKIELFLGDWGSVTLKPDRTYRGNTTFGPNSMLSGIVRIDGDLTLDGWIQGSGLLLVSGDVKIGKRGITSDHELVIWAQGNVIVSESNTKIEAVLVSESDIRISGSSVEVYGSLIARDDVTLSGNEVSIYK